MLTTETGNMAKVYHDTVANAERVDFIRRADERRGPLDAEIVAGCSPNWHVIETYAHHERIAAGHLVGRRFGIYLPETEYCEIRRGQKVEGLRLLLPGYVFIFVWDIERHYRRICAIPGVIAPLRADGQICVVPDTIINRLRAIENGERFRLTITVEEVVRKKRHRESRKTVREIPVYECDIIGVHAYSPYLEEQRQRETEIRAVQSDFAKAMGLVPQAS